jgi:hypothetical protein
VLTRARPFKVILTNYTKIKNYFYRKVKKVFALRSSFATWRFIFSSDYDAFMGILTPGKVNGIVLRVDITGRFF